MRDVSLDTTLTVFRGPIGQYSIKILLFTKMGKREKMFARYALNYHIAERMSKKPLRF